RLLTVQHQSPQVTPRPGPAGHPGRGRGEGDAGDVAVHVSVYAEEQLPWRDDATPLCPRLNGRVIRVGRHLGRPEHSRLQDLDTTPQVVDARLSCGSLQHTLLGLCVLLLVVGTVDEQGGRITRVPGRDPACVVVPKGDQFGGFLNVSPCRHRQFAQAPRSFVTVRDVPAGFAATVPVRATKTYRRSWVPAASRAARVYLMPLRGATVGNSDHRTCDPSADAGPIPIPHVDTSALSCTRNEPSHR